MASRSLLVLVTSLLCAGGTIFSLPANAETPLTQAVIQRLRNEVKLHPKQKQSRVAQKADVMTPGDALSTYRRAMAELRFNDRSLARIGEQAIFQFEPNTRSFDLRRGTVLLLIQPGQGRTRVRTPNAAAGIRGSALFMRYIEDSQVTMLGALTDSDIEITNNDGKTVVLKAGQMAYVYKDQIGVYNFDQKLFQETSPLFKDIDWNEAPAEVKAELDAALEGKAAIAGKYEDSPAWTKLADNRSNPPIAANASAQQLVMTERPNEGFYPNPSVRTSGTQITQIVTPTDSNPGTPPPPPPTSPPAILPDLSTESPSQNNSGNRVNRPDIVVRESAPGQPTPAPTQQPSAPVQVTPPAQITPPPAQIVQPSEPIAQPPAQIAQPPASAPQPIAQPPAAPTQPIAQPVVPTPPIAVTPTQPQTPPASQIPSATNPPTRPIAAPPPTQTPPVVTPPIGGRPAPVILPPVATPAIPATPTAGTGQPTIPATPAIPPTPVVPITAPTLVNTAPVAASTPPPAIVVPPTVVAPPAVATPPATPPVTPVAPATPPATAPMDMPAVQAVTTTAPASVPSAATATPAVNSVPATTLPSRTVAP